MNTGNKSITYQGDTFYKDAISQTFENILIKVKNKLVKQDYIDSANMIIKSNVTIPIKVDWTLDRVPMPVDYLILLSNKVYMIDLEFWRFANTTSLPLNEVSESLICSDILYNGSPNLNSRNVFSFIMKTNKIQKINMFLHYRNAFNYTKYKSIGLKRYLNNINIQCEQIEPVSYIICFNEAPLLKTSNSDFFNKSLHASIEMNLSNFFKEKLMNSYGQSVELDIKRIANIINNYSS